MAAPFPLSRTWGEGLFSVSALAFSPPQWDLAGFFNQQEPVGPAPRSGLGLEPSSECSPWPSPSSWASRHGDSWGLSCSVIDGGWRWEVGGERDRPCREPARSNNFPALCKRQSCGLNMLLCRGKKSLCNIKK